MTERNITHENGRYWVLGDRHGFTVYKNDGTASYADSSYERSEDGKSIAIARCDYLANRDARTPRKGG